MTRRSKDCCRVCGAESDYLFSGDLIGRPVEYFECARCEYVQTETPTWLNEAYAEPINVTDTGILVRNLQCRDLVLATLWAIGDLRGRVVDQAGGYGILVRLLRDVGVDAYWADLHSENLLARGFEFDVQESGRACLVTAFEAMEHFVDPVHEMEGMFGVSSNLLCSTELIPSPAPPPREWWYFGREHGQHIGFFRIPTLQYMARRFQKSLVTDGRFLHLFSEAPVNQHYWAVLKKIRPALHWVTRRKLGSKTWSDHELLGKVK
jgi:hypothetical protein